MLVLGEKSLMLEQPFSQDITTFTPYQIQKKTKVEAGQDLTAEYQKKLQEINKTKPISKPVMNVRVKKGVWSYETKKVEVLKNNKDWIKEYINRNNQEKAIEVVCRILGVKI